MMTIRNGSYTLLFYILLLLIPVDLSGQQKDFQSWWEVSLDKGLGNGIDLSGEFEQRFRNNSLQYDRTLVTVAGEYDVNKYLDVGAGARVILASNRELNLNVKYRLHVEATGSYPLAGFDLTLRVRFQYGFEDLFDPAFEGGNKTSNRYRLKVARHIFGTRVGWFASTEIWALLNNQSNSLFYKIRYSAGVRYNLNFSSQITVRYILENEFNVRNPTQAHILLIGYSHTL